MQAALFANPSVQTALFANPLVQQALFSIPAVQTALFADSSVNQALFGNATTQQGLFANPVVQQALFASPAVQQVLFTNSAVQSALFANHDVQTALFSNPTVQQVLFANPLVQAALFGSSSAQQALFGTASVQTTLFTNPGVEQALFANPTVQQILFANATPDQQAALFSNPATLQALFGIPSVQTALFGNPTVQQALFGNPTVQAAIFAIPAVQQALFGNPVIQQALFGNAAVQQAIFANTSAQSAIFSNPAAQSAIFGNPAVQQAIFANPAVLQTIFASNPTILQQVLTGNPALQSRIRLDSSLARVRSNINLAGSGNQATGSVLSSINLGSGGLFTQTLSDAQINLVNQAYNSDPSSLSNYYVNVTATGGNNVIVGGLLGNFTASGGNNRFVLEDPSLLGLSSALVPTATSTITGGGGNDTVYFVGSNFGHVALNEPAGTGSVTLDFSNVQGEGITNLNLNTSGEQEVIAGKLWLTLPSGHRETFAVAAVDVVGHIGGTVDVTDANGQPVTDPKTNAPYKQSVPDFYSFTGKAGDVMNLEVMSTALTRLDPNTFDSLMQLYDSHGQLIAESDDQFEPSDSLLIDLTLPSNDTYTVEVSAFHTNDSTFLDPHSDHYNPAAFYNAEHGNYELFMYRFGAYNSSSGTDKLIRTNTTSVALTSSSASSSYGQALTFTATVSAAGTPSGSVQFFADGNATPFATQSLDASGHASTAPITALSAGAHTITASYVGDDTFDSSMSDAISEMVAKAHLTVNADNQTKLYGSVNPTLSATITGFQNGESLATSGIAGTPSLTTTADATSHVGAYTVTVEADSLSAANYDFPTANFINGELAVTPASLTITADSLTKLYGAALPALTASISGFVNGDTSVSLKTQPTLTTTATTASHVASSPYAITAIMDE